MVYLDNAATTKPKFFKSDYSYLWFNSNASYSFFENDSLDNAEDKIKKCLGVNSGKLLFFRCATEAINWLASKLYPNTISGLSCEHESVAKILGHQAMADNGVNFITHQYVNQITGTIFPIKWIRKDFHESKFFLSDFTAAIGHVEIPDSIDSFCDAVWFSGHKFHAEKGIGCMWISDRLFEFLKGEKGRKNQYGLIHGTLDIPAVCSLADAFSHANMNILQKEEQWEVLSNIIIRDLNNNNIPCEYVADKTKRTHAINALKFFNIYGEALVNYLAEQDIYIGLGNSACSSNKDYSVLNFFDETEKLDNVVRISFDEDTTIHDVKQFISGVVSFNEMFKN